LIGQRLPAHYLELLSEALLRVYWYKGSFRTALRRAAVPDSLLAGWAAEETKRDFWARIMPDLETSDAGIAVLVRLADAVAEQTTFPDLERMEDSALRIKTAKKRLAILTSIASASARRFKSFDSKRKIAKKAERRARMPFPGSTPSKH
jgi:hypothetical protein